jgi:hypothetical protein
MAWGYCTRVTTSVVQSQGRYYTDLSSSAATQVWSGVSGQFFSAFPSCVPSSMSRSSFSPFSDYKRQLDPDISGCATQGTTTMMIGGQRVYAAKHSESLLPASRDAAAVLVRELLQAGSHTTRTAV